MDDGLSGESVSRSDAFRKYLSALRGRVGDAKYKSWFIDLGLADMNEDCVTLSTGSEAKRDMIDNRFMPILADTWRQEIGPVRKMLLTVQKNLSDAAAKVARQEEIRMRRNGVATGLADGRPAAGVRSSGGGQPSPAPGSSSPASGSYANGSFGAAAAEKAAPRAVDLNDIATAPDPRRTFEAFAVGRSNQIAWAAAQRAVAQGPARELIYIYGQSGVGKTHLLHAIAHEWAREPARGRSAYITYSNFSNACVAAIWSNSVKVFQNALLENDLLSVDDIHFLANKTRTQEELLNVIDAALDSGKQVVIAGELPPSKLAEAGINERLADRLTGGICAPVDSCDEALRLEVLKKRARDAAVQCEIADEVLAFIARTFTKSMRETIGALNQLTLMYGGERTVVDLDQAKTVLKSLMENRKGAATISDAMASGADAFGLKLEDITGRAQPQRIVRARHAIVWCAREVLKESFPSIGKSLKRDHTTVMSSYRRAQALLERDKAFQEAVRRIREALES